MSLFNHECREYTPDPHTHDLLHTIIHNQEKIMETINDLDTDIGTVETTLTKLGADLKAAIADLEAKINSAPNPTFDPTPEIARLNAIATAIGGLDTETVAADPGPATPAAPTPVATTTTLEVGTAAGPLTADTPIPLQGTVVGNGTVVPTGAVTITDSTAAVSLTASLDSTGAFIATTPGLPAGSYSLTAAYNGDAANEASSGSLSIVVSAAAA